MVNRTQMNGVILLGAGLLASSISSLLEHFAIFGSATDFATGFFDGLATGAFGVAIFLLVRGKRIAQ